MNTYKSLLRLEFKSRYGNSGQSIGARISKSLPAVLFFALIYSLYVYGVKVLCEMFHLHELEYEFLLLFIALSQIIFIAFGVSSVVKTLYYSGDNELLLRFPVSGEAVFGAKMTCLVVIQSIITIAVILPTFILFGIEIAAPWNFYFCIPFVILLSIILPVGVSNILAIPFMMVGGRVKNKFGGNLIFNVCLVAGGFAIYMGIVQSVVNFLQDQSLSFFSPETMQMVSKILKYVIPFKWFADLMYGQNLAVAIPCTIVVIALILFLATVVIKKLYMKTIIRKLEGMTSAFVKDNSKKVKIKTFFGRIAEKTYLLFGKKEKAEKVKERYTSLSITPKNKKHSVLYAVFKREFLDIFRSKNYSFQYLCMAVAGPVMVYFCNRLCISMGEASFAKDIVPAICMVVMMLFVTIIVSFAGSCVSKEGDNFYLTKISPVPPYQQVLVKVALYLVVAFASTIITTVVVIATGQIRYSYCLVIMGICLMLSIALTCFAVKLDIIKPSFPIGGDGELVNGNFATFVAMAVGLVLTIGCGVFGIVGIYIWGVGFTLGMIATVVGALMIASVCWLLIGISKSYEKITQK